VVRAAGRRGCWIKKGALTGVRRVLYRLPELVALAPGSLILVAEGPKKVEAAVALGLDATCNPGGMQRKQPRTSLASTWPGCTIAIFATRA
jgi:hypothetical protein